jgi:hypothetical protein
MSTVGLIIFYICNAQQDAHNEDKCLLYDIKKFSLYLTGNTLRLRNQD